MYCVTSQSPVCQFEPRGVGSWLQWGLVCVYGGGGGDGVYILLLL